MKKTRILTAFILTFALVLSAVPVFADTASVSTNDMNIKVNGIAVTVKGESYELEDGTKVPFSILYSGTTYLPMRKVAEFVGKEVSYDHAIKTATITSTTGAVAKPEECSHAAVKGSIEKITYETNSLNIVVDGTTVAKVGESYALEDGSKVPFSIVYKGTTYLPMRKMGELVGKNIGYDSEASLAEIREKVAAYKEYNDITDLGLIANIKALRTGKNGECVTYYYSADELNEADADIFDKNMKDSKYKLVKSVELPSLGKGANAEVYYNETSDKSILVGAMYDPEEKDASKAKMLVFVELHPGKYVEAHPAK